MPVDTTPQLYHDQQCDPKPPFLCAPYTADSDGGRFEPPRSIDRCPRAADGERCHLHTHSYRHRKSHPGIELQILHCLGHGHFFTVYPPGYVPYARDCLAVVDLPGEPIEVSEPEPEASCRGALFQAALDAAADQRWESEPIDGSSSPRYPTQWCHIQRCGMILGLDQRLPAPVVEEIRDHLGVNGLKHNLASASYQATSSLKVRGAAIVEVHQLIRRDRSLVLRLLAAGSVSGLWGQPRLWDAAGGQRFSLLSRTSRQLRAH